MLRNVRVKYGNTQSPQSLNLEDSRITIFVGPNNSGKSLALREIEASIKNGTSSDNLIIEEVVPVELTQDEIAKLLDSNTVETDKSNEEQVTIRFANVLTNQSNNNRKVNKKYILELNIKDMRSYMMNVIALTQLRLDGKTRFSLTESRPSADLAGPPTNHLMSLFKDDEARESIRQITADAFGLHFVIDPTAMNHFRIRMSKRPPIDHSEEQALDERARTFHAEAHDIAQLSDGVKAFTGLVSAVYSSNFKILMVDEPEAFLHPPLARKLGKVLAKVASERYGNLFVATHSPDFIMGCIQTGVPVNIVRLTYKNDVSTTRLLPPENLLPMMRDPLLRSVGVLSSLFHEGVIVTESDSDRAFYQEINERLLAEDRRGMEDCLFLNAQNKQTVSRIIKPLRDLGIPAAGIVDIDVIKEGGRPWIDLLNAAHVPEGLQKGLSILRSTVYGYFQASEKDMKRDGGIEILTGEQKESCYILFEQLSEYGIFVVHGGELESWLRQLGTNRNDHGSKWLGKVFELMGSNPNEADYLRPSNNDVWTFMESVAHWFTNPLRKGVPRS